MDPLARVFGTPARLKLLRLFYFNPHLAFSFSDISERTKLTPELVRKELGVLLTSKLLRRSGGTGELHYSVNRHFKHYEALETFLRTTTDVTPERMLEQFRRTGTLKLVILSGYFTGTQQSTVDCLLVGDIDEKRATKAIHSIEAELGRELRYSVLSAEDFRYRQGVYDRLVRDVLDYPHRVLIDKIGL